MLVLAIVAVVYIIKKKRKFPQKCNNIETGMFCFYVNEHNETNAFLCLFYFSDVAQAKQLGKHIVVRDIL